VVLRENINKMSLYNMRVNDLRSTDSPKQILQ